MKQRNMDGRALAWLLVSGPEPNKREALIELGKEDIDENIRIQLIEELLRIAHEEDTEAKIQALMLLATYRSRLRITGDFKVAEKLKELFHRCFTESELSDMANSLRRREFDNPSRWRRALFRRIILTLSAIDFNQTLTLIRRIAPTFDGTSLQEFLANIEG